jgi:6-phosphogluconolactonase
MGSNPREYHRIFVGTYTKGTSRGIYSVDLDRTTGGLGQPVLAAEAPNPTFMAHSPDGTYLYAVCSGPGWLSSFRVDPVSPLLTPVQLANPDSSPTPCHVAVDSTGRIALAANYHLALAAAIPLSADGTLGMPRVLSHSGKGPHPTKQTTAHVHSTNVSPDDRFALVCDLGLDRIYTYRINRDTVSLEVSAPPYISSAAGAGPRHLTFNAGGTRVYVINELDSTVCTYAYILQTGTLELLHTVTLLPQGYTGEAAAAEVRIHPNGRFFYASCRGPDILAVFSIDGVSGQLSLIETVPCGGKGPRSFSVSPDGEWLVCAHQGSDTLCSFKIDGASGRLQPIPGSTSISMPVCVLFQD